VAGKPEGDPQGLRAVIFDLAEPVVLDRGAELVDVEVSGSGTYNVRLLVYREAGVDVSLCEEVSREVSDLFDVEDPIPGRYRLEVTSPGLDRPLRSDGDFRRATGRLLKVVTLEGRTLGGRLHEFTDEEIVLQQPKTDDMRIAREQIAKATVEVEF
jgi:ribosome maturation factor RimP